MAGLPLLLVSGVDDALWDNAVQDLPGFCFFDSSSWLKEFSYKVDRVHRLTFSRGSKLVAAVCFGEKQTHNSVTFSFPFSASYGGILFRPRVGIADAIEVVEKLLAHCSATAMGKPFSVSYRQRPRSVTASSRYDLEEFSLLKNGFRLVDMQVDYDVDLSRIHYTKTKRHELGKASQVLSFVQTSMQTFVDFQNMVLQQQPEKIKTMPDAELLIIEAKFPETVGVFTAMYAGTPVAVLLSSFFSSKIALGRNWFQDRTYAKHNTTFFLVASWLEWLRENGYERACLGGTAQLSWPVSEGHAFFKEHFHPEADAQRKYEYTAP